MKGHKCIALKSLFSQHRLTGSTPRRPDILHTHLSTRQHHAAGKSMLQQKMSFWNQKCLRLHATPTLGLSQVLIKEEADAEVANFWSSLLSQQVRNQLRCH